MPQRSAGILLFRHTGPAPEVLLVHPGGPFFAKKDEGAWSIPKGEYEPGEDPLTVARREFAEEIGQEVPSGPMVELGEVRQSGGKVVTAWALEADIDVSRIQSNTFEIEWPPRSGRMQEFPEADRAEWLDVEAARRKLVKGQLPLLDVLLEQIASR